MKRLLFFLICLFALSPSIYVVLAEEVKTINMEKDYAGMSDSDKALYGLLYNEALLEVKLSSKEKEILEFSKKYFRENNDYNMLARCHYCDVRQHLIKYDYAGAIPHLSPTLEYAQKANSHILLGTLYQQLTDLALNAEDTDNAFLLSQHAVYHFRETEQKEQLANSLLVLSRIYLTRNDPESSLQMIDESMSLNQHKADSVTAGDILHDMGYTYYIKEQYDSAYHYLNQSINYPTSSVKRAAQRYLHMAQVCQQQEEYALANHYLHKALIEKESLLIKSEVYKQLALTATKYEQEKDNITYYYQQHKIYNDSLQALRAEITSRKGLTEIISILQEKRSAVPSNKKKGAYIATFGILLAGLFTSYKKRESLKRKKKETENKVSPLLTDNNNPGSGHTTHKNNGQIDSLTSHSIEDTEQFLKEMDSQLNSLPNRLKKKYPMLTNKELTWCCLYISNPSVSYISEAMQWKPTTHYKFKQRLSHKLGFHSTKELEQMLHEEAKPSKNPPKSMS